MRRAAVAVLALLFLYFAAHLFVAIRNGTLTDREDPPCHEDEACWDWRTMGNGCAGDGTGTTICVD